MSSSSEDIKHTIMNLISTHYLNTVNVLKGVLVIRRIFPLVDMITKPKFSNCPNIFKIGLFR